MFRRSERSIFLSIRLLLLSIILIVAPLFAAAQDIPSGITIHVVQRGETLYRISMQYGLTIEAIATANGITNPGNIQVGQRLLIPPSDGTQPVGTHRVSAGETLASIAEFYGLTPDALLSANSLSSTAPIYVGQILIIGTTLPPPGVELDSLPELTAALEVAGGTVGQSVTGSPVVVGRLAPAAIIHRVMRGETLFRIALQYGVEVNAIIQANAIVDPSLIYVGQELVIPGVEAPEIALDLPEPVTDISVMPMVFIEGQTGMFRLFTSSPVNVSGTFLDRPMNFASDTEGTRYTALVGIPLGTPPGVYAAIISVGTGLGAQQMEINVQIVSGGYGVETLNLIADRTNLLDPAVEQNELNILSRVMGVFDPVRAFDGAMGLPAAATITSPFGAVRAYNGGETRTHTGTDFGGVPGTPILAPAAGEVVLADTLNVRGVATVIDHGWGVYTGYWHQTDRYVAIGDRVIPGQVIGTIGSTGRVSGPHLHWELWVNGVPVDPMQWVILSFS
ncbi:LysM peptidoglycan-binding domain-containing protein [Anaerolineae bacterium CFX9]|nr:LysM peptidoglycan-binding domain-containing protein [Anaerolineae bacterium CFX9]